MSLCIGVGTVIRILSLLHTIKMHDYTELTGTCTKREVSPLTKKQKIIFRSTDQKEYHFTFDKISAFYLDIIIAYIFGMEQTLRVKKRLLRIYLRMRNYPP
mgnify:CR=1 FL=1